MFLDNFAFHRCLNRYYVAAGVRTYSQETWRSLILTSSTDPNFGRLLVGKYASFIVDYYCKQATADNHAVREAACSCIAELAVKIEKKFICDFVGKLLDVLIACFKDESWPVRDAACVGRQIF